MTNQTHKVIEEGVAEFEKNHRLDDGRISDIGFSGGTIEDWLTQYSQKLVEVTREELLEEAKEEPANNLAKWLHEHHTNLGPHVWEACCRVFGSGGTPEATMAYKQIVFTIKQTLTKDTPAED